MENVSRKGGRINEYRVFVGVRVLSSLSLEMIQKVPLVVQQIFRINSTDPGSYLLEDSKQF